MNYKLCRSNFSKFTFLFFSEEIKPNTVIVEGGYTSGIPTENIKTCTNQNSLVVKVVNPLCQYFVEALFAAMTAMSVFGVGLYQLCTVTW